MPTLVELDASDPLTVQVCPVARLRDMLPADETAVLERWLAEPLRSAPRIQKALTLAGHTDPLSGRPVSARRISEHRSGTCCCR